MCVSTKHGKRLQPVARHGILTQPNPLLQALAILGVIVGVVVLSGLMVGGFTVWNAARAVDETSVDLVGQEDGQLPPALGELKGGINLLLVGTDSCEGNEAFSQACRSGETEGERNDVTMLVHISDNPRRVTVVSFPRDTIVDIPSCPDGEGGETYGSTEKINVSYFYGGLPCTVLTVKQLTGVDIQYAAAIRWTGVINMSDAVGGVEVCVSGEINDPDNTGLHLTEGRHELQGVQALQFLRVRHGIGDGSDLGRVANQMQFMTSLVRKLQSDGVLGNPQILMNFAFTAVRQVESGQLLLSSSLANPNRMVQIAMALRSVPLSDFVFVQYPTMYADGGASVLPLYDDAAELFAKLAENRPLQLTGATGNGYSTEVVEEVADPSATAAPTDPSAAPTDPSVPSDAAQLPSSITGQTAAQVTCTVPEE